MSALAQQLEQLKKQQEELEKKIQKVEETKKKLNTEASIGRIEALVEPLTEYLNWFNQNKRASHCFKTNRELEIERKELYNRNYPDRKQYPPFYHKILLEEEIYITLIGVLKKQEQKIKELEKRFLPILFSKHNSII